ncbi:hypothetical protein ACFOQM_04120 [Paenibacillus sp. GCM10012307]|uniref:SAF domain-containing protein n=1 Tax=Paenibacillus roseus TaxID=2798579 RepID=A0A934J2Q2_9BACL|nr:hypothetical protein [Paenibacillus roseus]MBJ6360499.1 hypothetical protein [Paenibacillus roseus]
MLRIKLRMMGSLAIFILGTAMLAGLYYYGPKWNTKPVVITTTLLHANEVITPGHLKIMNIPKDNIPAYAITVPDQLIGLTALNVIPSGSMLYEEWFDQDPLIPVSGEVILPVPSSSLYAVNSSLRAKDRVNILFFRTVDNRNRERSPQDETIDLDDPAAQQLEQPSKEDMIPNVSVVSVRSSGGNMVMDTPEGKSNDRLTTSEQINNVELLATDDMAKIIQKKLEAGYTLWIARTK